MPNIPNAREAVIPALLHWAIWFSWAWGESTKIALLFPTPYTSTA